MKNLYDLLLIIKPNLGDDTYKKYIADIQSWLTKEEGEIVEVQEWGLQSTGPNFKNYSQGFYLNILFKGTAKTVDNLNEKIHVTEDILRHINIRAESLMTTEQIQEIVNK